MALGSTIAADSHMLTVRRVRVRVKVRVRVRVKVKVRR